MRLKHKVFSWLLLFSMFVGLLPQITVSVFAADESSYKQMTMYDQNSTTPISITENTVLTLGGTNTITSTGSPIQLADGVTLSIVMSEGSETTLTCTATEADVDSVQGKTAGIYVPKTATLNIRNANDLNPGKLTVTGGYGGAGIGGGSLASAYEDKDMGKAADGGVGNVAASGVSTYVSSASPGYTYLYTGYSQQVRNRITQIPDGVLNFARSLVPANMPTTPGGTGGTNGKNAVDNTQDCGTVVIKGGTIYAYGGQGGAGIGGGSGVNGENGGNGGAGNVGAGTAYGETSQKAVSRGADGYLVKVKSSIAGSSGGGAGGNGGNGGRGSNGGDITIDGGTIVAVGGKNGTATAAGIGSGAGGTGGTGGNGGNGGSADTRGLAGRGGDGQAGYGGNGGNSGDAGKLTINGGKVIAKGNNGFGIGNTGSVGSNGKTRGQSRTAGTAGGSSWKTSWNIVQESDSNLAYYAATAVYEYNGAGGNGGDGGKSTKTTAISGDPGTAGANTINKTDSNVVFMDDSGKVSSNNLPTNGKEKLYEYNLLIKNAGGETIENASVKVRDASGNIIAQSVSRTAEEAKQIAEVASGANVSRYSKGVATLWLPVGTYTLSGYDITDNKDFLAEPKKIVVTSNESGVGGSGTAYIGAANLTVNWGEQYWDAKVPNKFTYNDAEAKYKLSNGNDGKVTQLTIRLKNGVTVDVSGVGKTPTYASTSRGEYIWIFNTKGAGETSIGLSPTEVSEMLRKMVFYYDEETAVESGSNPMEIVAELDANGISENLVNIKLGIYDHPDGTKHYYTAPMFSGSAQWHKTMMAASMRLLGRGGYAATLNSVAEITWVRNNIQNGNFAIGASRMTYSNNVGEKVIMPITWDRASVYATANYVLNPPYWMDGPEKGEDIAVGSDGSRYHNTAYGNPYQGVITDRNDVIYFLNSYSDWPAWPMIVEFGGWEPRGKQDPGERNASLVRESEEYPSIRKRTADSSRLYRYYLTVYDGDTNQPVEGAAVDVTSITDTPNKLSYVTDANGVAVIWLPEGSHTLSGAMVTKDGKQIIDTKKTELTVRADHYNAGAVYIGGINTSLKVELGDFEYNATEANTLTFPNAKVMIGESNIDTKVKWMKVAGTDTFIKTDSITSEGDAVFTKDASGNTPEVAWYFETPKTVAEATEILKNLTYYYEKKEGSTGAVKAEVDANETTANTKALTIKEYNGHFYALTSTSTDKTWDGSYTNAKTYTYRGRMGYLATLTTAEEEKFTHDAFGISQYWIGGTSLVDKSYDAAKNKERMVDRKSIAAGEWKNLNLSGGRTAVIPYYYWSAGPEAGETIEADRWNAGDPSGGNDVATFMYYQNSDRQGLWDFAETQTLNSLIEFGGYNAGNDPGGYDEANYSSDTVNLVERTDHNGTSIYKYTAKVYDVATQNVVEGAVLNIKVPSPDGDPNKAYVYKGDEGGVKTDANGEVILWLPAGKYTPKDKEVYKDGIGGLNPSIDSTFEVTNDDKGETIYFWIGESSIEVKLGMHDVTKDENGELWITFPNAEVIKKTGDAEEGTMLSISVDNVDDSKKINVSDAVNATEDWDMTDLVNHTYVWVFGTDGAGSNDKAQTILRSVKFPYSKDIQISVELDSNQTSDTLKKENSGQANGYLITNWQNNGHYYLYYPGAMAWTSAYNKAKEYTFGGRKGYLGTMTTTEERDYMLNINKNQNVWLGGTRLVYSGTSQEIADDEVINRSANVLMYKTGVALSDAYYWACGPEVGKNVLQTVTPGLVGVDGATWYKSITQDPTVLPADTTYESCLQYILSAGQSPRINDLVEGNTAGSMVSASSVGFFVEFGGYREGMDPAQGISVKRAKDTRTITELEAYYTYPVVDANDIQKNTYADKQAALEANGGYKATLTTAFKEAVAGNTDYVIDADTTWTSGTALPNPMPEAEYTYDMGKYPVISITEMFKGMAELTKIDLSLYSVTDTVQYLTNMFTNTGKATDGFPAVGLANAAEAAKFNDEAQTGIDRTKLYFGNVTKVEGETQPGYRYDGNATSIDLETAGVESYTITGTGGTVTLTEAELTSDPYTFDLNQVFNDTDKTNATAGSLRTTVTIVKIMAQQNLGVEAYFNGDMTTANPSAAIMRGAWANESEGYVDFYVRDVGNADGKISVENLKKLKVTADLSYGFENVAAFQTGDKADWYKNILESDLAMYLVKADGTETDIATLISENNTNPIVFAPAVDNSKPETEDKTEAKDNTADNTEEETSSTTDETTPADGEQTTEPADTATDGELGSDSNSADENADADVTTDANADENTAEEPKAEEATEPKAEEETENADISTFSSEDDIALMALTYLDDAEIVTFTDALGNEQKYTRIRVKVSNVLASGIVTFKLSYNTGTDADTGEAVYEAINSAEYDVIVPGDVDKDGVIANKDILVLRKVLLGVEKAEKGRANNYLFELSDMDRDDVLANKDVMEMRALVLGTKKIGK